jgi:hypothetical protein
MRGGGALQPESIIDNRPSLVVDWMWKDYDAVSYLLLNPRGKKSLDKHGVDK